MRDGPIAQRACPDRREGAPDPIGLGDYQLRLPSFEGPLDVLLRLIERDQLAISEVSLVAVTNQFLSYLATLRETSAALVAQFAAVAARLVLLKSRSLLPRPPVAEEDEPDELVRQLIEYRVLRAAAAHLAGRDRVAAGAFARGESFAFPEAPPARLIAPEVGALARALRRRLTIVPTPTTEVAAPPVVTLRQISRRMLDALSRHRSLSFLSFCRGCADRQEVLVAFLAVLILDRRRVIEAAQEELFGEITLHRIAATSGADRTLTQRDGTAAGRAAR